MSLSFKKHIFQKEEQEEKNRVRKEKKDWRGQKTILLNQFAKNKGKNKYICS